MIIMHLFLSTLAALPLCSAALVEVDLSDISSKTQSYDAQAQYELAMIYFTGDGLQKDCSDALRWYRCAAAQGLGGDKLFLKIQTDLRLTSALSSSLASSSSPAPSSAETEHQASLRYYEGDEVPINLEKGAKYSPAADMLLLLHCHSIC